MTSWEYFIWYLIFFYDSSGRASPSETKSEKSSVTQMTSFSGGTGGSTLGAKLSHDQGQRNVRCPDSFVSIQLEKVSWICQRIMVMLGSHYKDSCHDWNRALQHECNKWRRNIKSTRKLNWIERKLQPIDIFNIWTFHQVYLI